MSVLEKKVDALMRFVAAQITVEMEAAKKKIAELLAEDSGIVKRVDNLPLETMVRQMLTELGVPEHIKGHRYAVSAICMMVEDPAVIERVTKTVYPEVATAHQTTASRVERAIRHAIEVSWDRCDPDILHKYFGGAVSPLKGKPTNSEFIAWVSNIIRLRMNGAV